MVYNILMQKINTSKINWDLDLIKDATRPPLSTWQVDSGLGRQLHTSGVCNDMVAWFEEEKQKAIEVNYIFINKWKDRADYLESPQALKTALDELEILESTIGTTGSLSYYFGLKSALDQTNPDLLSRLNKVEEFAVKIANDMEFFSHKLAHVSIQTQKIFLESEALKDYRHMLKGVFDNAKYMLSEPEEKILNLKGSVSHGNWVHMTSSLLSKEEREVVDEDGETTLKNFSEITSLLNSKSKITRDSVAIAFNEIQAKWSDVAENEINSILQDKKINDELRGITRPDLPRHISDDIDSKVVDTLLKTVTANFDISKDFYKVKAKAMGVEKLEYHERNVEVGEINGEFGYEKSVELVYKVLNDLDSKFGDIFKMFVENGQIDVFPKKGKRGGAFCTHELKTQPTYILLNHTNKLTDVLTLAHEVGHGINNELMRVQSSFYFDTPLSTAEVASTFFEDFVLDELLKGVDEQTAYAIKMQKLNDDISTVIRQVACYNFELQLHNKFREVGYLSKDQIGEIFSKNMSAYMGDYVEQSAGSENWWVYWGHIRSFFYVYSYASGLLISKALQKMVKEDKSNIEKVKKFLSYGSSKAPKDIFLELGIDILDSTFWQKGLDEVKDLLKEVE